MQRYDLFSTSQLPVKSFLYTPSPAGNGLARRSESPSEIGEAKSEGLEGPSEVGEAKSEGFERPSEVGEVDSEGLERASEVGEVPSEFKKSDVNLSILFELKRIVKTIGY